jgi:hypothetical protein
MRDVLDAISSAIKTKEQEFLDNGYAAIDLEPEGLNLGWIDGRIVCWHEKLGEFTPFIETPSKTRIKHVHELIPLENLLFERTEHIRMNLMDTLVQLKGVRSEQT